TGSAEQGSRNYKSEGSERSGFGAARSGERKPFGRPADGDAPGSRPFKSREESSDRPRKSYGRPSGGDAPRSRPFKSREESSDRPRKSYGRPSDGDAPRSRPFKSREESSDRPRKSYGRPSDGDAPRSRPFKSREESSDRPRKSYGRPSDGDAPRSRPFNNREESSDRPRKSYGRPSDGDAPRSRPFNNREESSDRPRKSFGRSADGEGAGSRPYKRRDEFKSDDRPARRSYKDDTSFERRGNSRRAKPVDEIPGRMPEKKEFIRLNKYLADAGICSRREADQLIQAGTVMVNGEIVTQLGTKVSINDKVNYGGQTLRREKLRYVLLNKPKGYITTADDPFERKTVMELVKNACEERLYPVGRLDRNTLGLLLLTNDGDLAKKMTHPKHGVKKLYHVELDKPLTKHDMLRIAEGLELEDGVAEVDAISYVSKDESRREVGIEIHSGKNRIVRRIFEQLDYKVVKLDRVILAGLTKLDLPRGMFRHLTPAEVSMLMRIK
ncbi:MAG TPA: pseudouridine synthase, partial [Bacteroidales bacterium]|nr:pseudouridine synthase [Bacteroidales bacterium]